MAGTDLRRRLTVAGVGIPAGVIVIYLGVWPVAVLLSIVAALGTGELYTIAERGDCYPFRRVGMIVSGLLVLLAAWAGSFSAWSVYAVGVLLGLTLLSLAGAVFLRLPDRSPLASVAVTVLAALYLGSTLSFGVHIRVLPGVSDGSPGWSGAIVLIFPLVVTWVGDSAAYFSGRRWGRAKLLHAVSPGKTRAGAVGGLFGAVVAAAAYSALLINPHTTMTVSLLSAAALGVLLGCIAQVGDLAESLLKREGRVKDSGMLLPGHGGMLDRFDSVLFTLPMTYALLLMLLGP